MGTRPYEPFTPAFFTPLLPQLKLVVSASAGYDEMPVTFFTSQAVYFCNTRHAVAEPTADMTLYLLLAVIRDLSRSEKSAREGKWNRAHIPNRDPSGLTLGIIGMGGIGKHVARKAGAFNLKVTYYNRHRLPAADEEKHNVTYCETLDDLLNTSDVISIHCPLNSSTRHMLTTKEFALMKDGVLIINTARGAIIDEDALIAAMESGKVSRAGMDVFDDEPNIRPYFRESERCVLQPHLGGLTTRARRDAERECLENIVAWWKTGRPVAPVNEIESQ
ncbi:hypothetical protein B7494_g4082 [Chlorociboria aeruginascens]|nr:hypothetical protein B7494_g4082 [Chlorociboria aeruginascens]